MPENQAELYKSNTCSPSRIGARSGLVRKYWRTPLGSAVRCGKIDPGTEAMASRSSSRIAVRILVSCRHPHRSHSTGPSVGEAMASGSS